MRPSERADIVSALRFLDLTNEREVAQIHREFYATRTMPSRARLTVAATLLNAIGVALDGDDARVWRALERGLAAMALDPRNVAIDCLQELARFRLDTLATNGNPAEELRRMADEAHDADPREAFEALRGVDRKLASLSEEEAFSALEGVSSVEPKRGRGNKSVFFALARLMLRKRFGGASQKSGESESAAAQRVSRLIQDEHQRAPRRSRGV